MAKKKTIVYVTGIFDLFHVGHVEFLKKAKALGDYLIVGVHDDEDASFYKRVPIIPFKERMEILKSVKYVDKVIRGPMTKDITPEFYKKHKIDIQCAAFEPETLHFYQLPISMGIMRFVKYSPLTSTTAIIEKIRKMNICKKS